MISSSKRYRIGTYVKIGRLIKKSYVAYPVAPMPRPLTLKVGGHFSCLKLMRLPYLGKYSTSTAIMFTIK